MKKQLTTVLVLPLSFFIFFSSCIKEEPQNSECDILSAWVEGEAYESCFYQATQMRVENLPSNSSSIVFPVRSLDSLPPLPVHFTLTPGATISPANGSLQDFSHGPVTYTVTSEDGAWTRSYRVGFQAIDLNASLFSFEHVDIEAYSASNCTYHTFYEEDSTGGRRYIWASGNAGVAVVHEQWGPERFPTRSAEEGYLGKGVCLTTQLTGDLGAMMHKPIAAGNLFIGRFNINAVLTNTLKATEFGIPVDRKPTHLGGWYRYRPGAVFTDADLNEVPGRVDEAHIYAVFYRNHDENGNPVTLDGTNVLTSPYIISRTLPTPLPPTDEWTHFDMDFEDCSVDPALLSTMGYSFTVVFSSSRGGDFFEGAVGSTLYVDEVEVGF